MQLRDAPPIIKRGITALRTVRDLEPEINSDESLDPLNQGFIRPENATLGNPDSGNSSDWVTMDDSESDDSDHPKPPGGSGIGKLFRRRLNQERGSFDPTTDSLQQVKENTNNKKYIQTVYISYANIDF